VRKFNKPERFIAMNPELDEGPQDLKLKLMTFNRTTWDTDLLGKVVIVIGINHLATIIKFDF